jgi:glycosyltransferase involved in cell wall biosynthesis
MVAPIDVLYVFTARKRRLLAGVEAGTDPDTLLFGLNQLRANPNHGVAAWEAPSPVMVDFHEPVFGRFGRAAMSLVGRLGPDAVQLRTLARFAGRDVAFLTGGWPLLFASRLIPAARRPRIVWLNMTLTNLLRRGGTRATVLAAAARLADRIVCVSSDQQAFLVRRLGLPVSRLPVVLNGTDSRFFSPELVEAPVSSRKRTCEDSSFDASGSNDRGGASGERSSGFPQFVLAAGRDAARDYQTLAEALAGTALPAVVVCSPANLEAVRLPPGVEVRFDVPPTTLRDLYARASVVVVPTRGDGDPVGSDCSGTLVALDALAMGRPVVVTARASVPEYVTPGRHVTTVPPGDAAALRVAISRAVSSHPATAKAVADEARAGQAHVRLGRTTDHFAAGIASVFREVA